MRHLSSCKGVTLLVPSAIGRGWLFVGELMQALLPSSAYERPQNYLPKTWHKGEDKQFGKTVEDYVMWFNDIIRSRTPK